MKKRKIFTYILLGLFLMFTVIHCLEISKVFSMPSEFYASYSELNQTKRKNPFGRYIKMDMKNQNINTGAKDKEEETVVFKLFGIIPIKKVKAKILPEEEVYIGGVPIGMKVDIDGVLVISENVVDIGNNEIIRNKHLKAGDLIIEIDDKKISNIEDISSLLNDKKEDTAKVTYIRNNKKKTEILPILKDEEGRYKLGIWGKNTISGIGTLTFAKGDNKYGALGHAITNGKDESAIPITGGNIYDCKVVGFVKGQKNKPGQIKGLFVEKDEEGNINKNSNYGIYGKLDQSNDLIDKNLTAKLGGRLGIKPGDAKIISNISGIREEYDIEIIKANYQSTVEDKSIVFRVKDRRLIDLTGGIIQGMSGSPIIQNDKIVGAVTHVFISDPTKGYGIYCDWMIEQMDF